MLMEIMGLHLPGATFVNPNTPLRDALTRAAAQRVTAITALGNDYTPVGEVVDERADRQRHGRPARDRRLDQPHASIWSRSRAPPASQLDLGRFRRPLARSCRCSRRIYPNGLADVNHFHAAGGMAFLIGELLDAGLLHADVRTVAGDGGLARYREEPVLDGDAAASGGPARARALDAAIVRAASPRRSAPTAA